MEAFTGKWEMAGKTNAPKVHDSGGILSIVGFNRGKNTRLQLKYKVISEF